MIPQKPYDRQIKNFRIVAIAIGICLAFVVLTSAAVIFAMPSEKRANMPFIVWVNEAILILGIVAYVQFVTTRFKKSKSLRLFLVFSCFTNLVSICFYSFILLYPMYSNLPNKGTAIEHIVMAGVLGITDFISVVLLQKIRVPHLTIESNTEDRIQHFQPVGKVQRLINLVLDIVVIVFTASSHLIVVSDFFLSDTLIAIANIAMIPVYYFVMETILKTTVGKVTTNSIIVDEKGEKAPFGRVLLRAFCRFIPFDAVSFLFSNRGWHDKLSGTYVVNDRYAWEDEEDVLSTYFTGEAESELTTTLIQ